MNNQMYTQVHQGLKTSTAFDSAAFERLTDDTDQDVTLKVLAHFSMTLQEVLSHVAEGIRKDDAEMVWKACHKIAGSAELVGFNHFGTYSRSLNMAIRAMNELQAHQEELKAYLEEGKELVADIQRVFPRLKEYL